MRSWLLLVGLCACSSSSSSSPPAPAPTPATAPPVPQAPPPEAPPAAGEKAPAAAEDVPPSQAEKDKAEMDRIQAAARPGKHIWSLKGLESSGGLAWAAAQQALKGQLDLVGPCFDDGAAFELSLTVDEHGDVSEARAAATAGSSLAETVPHCVSLFGKRLHFNLGKPVPTTITARVTHLRSDSALGVIAESNPRVTRGGAFASITGTGDFSSGLEDKDIQGGLLGNEVGEMQGGYGFGRIEGGGTVGLGTIGTGKYGTMGRGTGSGYGAGAPRPPSAVNLGTITTSGSLDKAIVRRYIRQKLPQTTYCYEKQLIAKPAIEGTVTLSFTIGSDGKVSGVSVKGFDADVDACLESMAQGITFPAPPDKDAVKVSVPYLFKKPS